MLTRNYTVKGEDVNDFMVMQNSAYLKYTTKILDTFLYVNQFTKLKMNTLQIGLLNNNDSIQQYKPLLFTKAFSIVFECKSICNANEKMSVVVYFYNVEQELCAMVTREFYWFNYQSLQVEIPPKRIRNYFTDSVDLLAAS